MEINFLSSASLSAARGDWRLPSRLSLPGGGGEVSSKMLAASRSAAANPYLVVDDRRDCTDWGVRAERVETALETWLETWLGLARDIWAWLPPVEWAEPTLDEACDMGLVELAVTEVVCWRDKLDFMLLPAPDNWLPTALL